MVVKMDDGLKEMVKAFKLEKLNDNEIRGIVVSTMTSLVFNNTFSGMVEDLFPHLDAVDKLKITLLCSHIQKNSKGN